MPIQDFGRERLLFAPLPVHRLDRLTRHAVGAAIWAKRDDVSSGVAFGGNKTRTLEDPAADALATGGHTGSIGQTGRPPRWRMATAA